MYSLDLVSVILPVYNAAPFLKTSIESILQQTYSNLELIIIDDGSTDNSLEIIQDYADQDERIIYKSRHNQGLSASLNEAINLASGSFIARMDADDISLITRIERQVFFLNSHPNISIVSSSYIPFNANKTFPPIIHPSNYQILSLLLTCCCPVCHPAVMVRADVFQHYCYQNVENEDHDLWCDIASKYNLSNILDPLLLYRLTSNSLSGRNKLGIYFLTKRKGFMYFLKNCNKISLINVTLLHSCHNIYPRLPWLQAKFYFYFAKILSFIIR